MLRRLTPSNASFQVARPPKAATTAFPSWPSAFGLLSAFGFRPSDLPLLALLLAGCAVGPNYQRPRRWAPTPCRRPFPASLPPTGDWKPAQPSAHLPRGSWWEIFGDPELNRLETLATTNNQQLAAAYANLQQARALVNVARADFFPQLSAAPSFTRQRISASQSAGAASSSRGFTFNTFTVPLDASWELDLWGRVRREVEGARASLTASADDLESSKLAIQAEVSIDYFTLRGLDAQDQVLQETVVAYGRSLELTRIAAKVASPPISTSPRPRPSSQPPKPRFPPFNCSAPTPSTLWQSCAAGMPPAFEVSATQGALTAARKTFDAGPGVPVAVPSELLERRPDIAAAERLMAAANANVGLAYAAFFPRVMFNASGGFLSVDANTVFDWKSRFWSLGPRCRCRSSPGAGTAPSLPPPAPLTMPRSRTTAKQS